MIDIAKPDSRHNKRTAAAGYQDRRMEPHESLRIDPKTLKPGSDFGGAVDLNLKRG
jgi:hypothetical protein